MSWFRVVMIGLLPRRRPVFDTRTSSVNFVVEAVTQALGFHCLPRYFPVGIITSVPHSHLLLNITVIRRWRRQTMGNLKKWGAQERKDLSHCLSSWSLTVRHLARADTCRKASAYEDWVYPLSSTTILRWPRMWIGSLYPETYWTKRNVFGEGINKVRIG